MSNHPNYNKPSSKYPPNRRDNEYLGRKRYESDRSYDKDKNRYDQRPYYYDRDRQDNNYRYQSRDWNRDQVKYYPKEDKYPYNSNYSKYSDRDKYKSRKTNFTSEIEEKFPRQESKIQTESKFNLVQGLNNLMTNIVSSQLQGQYTQTLPSNLANINIKINLNHNSGQLGTSFKSEAERDTSFNHEVAKDPLMQKPPGNLLNVHTSNSLSSMITGVAPQLQNDTEKFMKSLGGKFSFEEASSFPLLSYPDMKSKGSWLQAFIMTRNPKLVEKLYPSLCKEGQLERFKEEFNKEMTTNISNDNNTEVKQSNLKLCIYINTNKTSSISKGNPLTSTSVHEDFYSRHRKETANALQNLKEKLFNQELKVQLYNTTLNEKQKKLDEIFSEF